MKQAFAGALLAAVVFTVAVFAYSSTRPNAVTPKQFNALKTRVTKLEKANTAILGYIGNCLLQWAPVTQYGSGTTHSFGYSYSNDGSTYVLEPALAFTQPGSTVSVYMPATTNVSCTSSRALSAVHVTRLHSGALKSVRMPSAQK